MPTRRIKNQMINIARSNVAIMTKSLFQLIWINF